jgi:aspartate racemase
MRVKMIGIVGGIGPESTIAYYRHILAAYRERRGDDGAPSIVINSIDVRKMLGLIGENQLPQVTDYLLDAVNALARAGAGCALLASKTPHIVFDEIQRRSPIPLVSIVQATCDAVKAMGLLKPGLLGTRFTMQGRFYQNVFHREGLALALPSTHEQDYIHGKYINELLNGILLPETRKGLLDVIARLKEREGIDGVILGGTELPLILSASSACDIPLLDTAQIHARSIVAYALSTSS